ncbi:unnamed protein product [Arabis nemorensis]|uniref:Uncharacterized protein n=1 Tax=Arabis nemorensis TaxID=586526 RepID=A0A565C1W9_9BRAS|nr:unnamed protein product [Arabis nemorensis]
MLHQFDCEHGSIVLIVTSKDGFEVFRRTIAGLASKAIIVLVAVAGGSNASFDRKTTAAWYWSEMQAGEQPFYSLVRGSQ